MFLCLDPFFMYKAWNLTTKVPGIFTAMLQLVAFWRVGTLPETNIARNRRPCHHFLQGRKEVEGWMARCAVITRFRRCVFFLETCWVGKKTVLSNFWHLFRNMKIIRLSVAFSPHFFAYISFDEIFLRVRFLFSCVERKVPFLVSMFTKSLAMLLFLYVPRRREMSGSWFWMMMWQWILNSTRIQQNHGDYLESYLLLVVQKSGIHQLRLVVYPSFLQCFIHPRWCRIFAINSRTLCFPG